MKLTVSLFVTLALAAASGAETAQQRGKRVVDEALKAVGGSAYLAMEDRVETGRAYSFYREKLEGLSIAKIYTRYVTPSPGLPGVRERQNFGKDEYAGVLFNEQGGWEVTFRGARPLETKRLENWRDGTMRNIFYILRQRLNEPGMDFYSRGSDLYENLPVEIVDITDSNGLTVTVYFSQLTKLPVRQELKRRNTDYKDFDKEETLFAKYRNVGGGVMWPMSIRRQRNGEKLFEMYSDSVQINKNLKDDLFTLPGSIKLLPKDK
uniref:Outer membrane lipoprotein-sorting protein n=1 Tax=Solibacter usitatus (strain Ellin6076) TaxID=234267 RepID=Q01SM5_SOLUE